MFLLFSVSMTTTAAPIEAETAAPASTGAAPIEAETAPPASTGKFESQKNQKC